ncbi:MAG: hypothetical protein OES84_00365 [Kiritimatiellaceae bacterium]|nr:hypothetical protein [Kiritimatiellaceae bacterium]
MKTGIRTVAALTAILAGTFTVSARPQQEQGKQNCQRQGGQHQRKEQSQNRLNVCPHCHRPITQRGQQQRQRQFQNRQQQLSPQQRQQLMQRRQQFQSQKSGPQRRRNQQFQGQRASRYQGGQRQCPRWDKHQLNPQQRQIIMQKRQEFIKKFDTDGDGQLSNKERKKAKKQRKINQRNKTSEQLTE